MTFLCWLFGHAKQIVYGPSGEVRARCARCKVYADRWGYFKDEVK